jgi:hypothetical protein
MYVWKIDQTYLGRGHIGVDVFTGSLTCLLDLGLLLVEHDLACLDGTAFRQSELRPRDRTSFGDDLEEEAGLENVSKKARWMFLVGEALTFSVSVQPFGAEDAIAI